jgi:hypothetical protein
MGELSSGQKLASLAIMVLAAGLTALASVIYLPALLRQALIAGADQSWFFLVITGFLLAISFAAWVVTCRICALIQKDRDVWGKIWFLAGLFIAVVAANSIVTYGPGLLAGKSDQTRLDQLTANTQGQLTNDVKAYQKELKKLGYPDFLQPPSLGVAHGLERAKEKLKQARTITERYRIHGEQLLAENRRAIESMPIAEVSKIKALAKFDERRARTAEDRARCWQIQDAMMGEYLVMIDDLAKARNRWTAMGLELLFERQADLDKFNEHLKTTAGMATEAGKAQRRLELASQPDPT